jgi:hypothetical protein
MTRLSLWWRSFWDNVHVQAAHIRAGWADERRWAVRVEVNACHAQGVRCAIRFRREDGVRVPLTLSIHRIRAEANMVDAFCHEDGAVFAFDIDRIEAVYRTTIPAKR